MDLQNGLKDLPLSQLTSPHACVPISSRHKPCAKYFILCFCSPPNPFSNLYLPVLYTIGSISFQCSCIFQLVFHVHPCYIYILELYQKWLTKSLKNVFISFSIYIKTRVTITQETKNSRVKSSYKNSRYKIYK
jgi:hypothetical protein